MWGRFTKKATELSGHYIDWSRIGELFASNHRYSKGELLLRRAMIAITVLSGYLGYKLNNQEKTGYSDLNMGMLSALVGFVVPHTIVIAPLIIKRCKMSRECKKVILDINAKVAEFRHPVLSAQIAVNVEFILQHSLSDDKHARASQTWGHRLRLLQNVKASLEGKLVDVLEFWNEARVEAMIKKLDNFQREEKHVMRVK